MEAWAVGIESVAICDAAQASIDATQDRDALSDTPWVAPEMKKIIEATFKCRAGDR